MLKFEQSSPSSRRRNTPPQLVTEETRAALLKREGEDESGVRKIPRGDSSRDRSEYVPRTEVRPARQPKIVHEEKIQIRERARADDEQRTAEISEQIQGQDHASQFNQSAEHAFAYADTVLGPLKEASANRTLNPETASVARNKLTKLLEYFRENLQREGLTLAQTPKIKKNLEEIHYRIVNIGQMIYHLDTLSRRAEIQNRYAGGEYELKPITPKEIPDTELGAMAKKWNQKPPEPSTWGKVKGMWKSLWK